MVFQQHKIDGVKHVTSDKAWGGGEASELRCFTEMMTTPKSNP